MAGYLRSIDPARHLVTTSFAFSQSHPVWAEAGLDYTQVHNYSDINPGAGIAGNMATWLPEHNRTYKRPVLFGEFGVDSRGPAETFAADPTGIGFHDGLWAGALSSSFGTGMTWWWDNYIDVEPDRFYPMFGAVARFVDGIHWSRERLAPAPLTATSPSRPLFVTGMQGPGARGVLAEERRAPVGPSRHRLGERCHRVADAAFRIVVRRLVGHRNRSSPRPRELHRGHSPGRDRRAAVRR